MQDTLGKDNIDEKMVALVTGAKEPIKKQRYGSRLGPDGEMNIFEILQMFRDNHGGQRFAGLGADPIHQLLLAAAHGDPENEGSEDELEDDHFGEDGSGFGEYGVENFQAHQEERKDDDQERRIMGGGLVGTNIIGGRRPAQPTSSPERREIGPQQIVHNIQRAAHRRDRDEEEHNIEPEGRPNQEERRHINQVVIGRGNRATVNTRPEAYQAQGQVRMNIGQLVNRPNDMVPINPNPRERERLAENAGPRNLFSRPQFGQNPSFVPS